MVSLLFFAERVETMSFKDWEAGLVVRNSSASRQHVANPKPLR